VCLTGTPKIQTDPGVTNATFTQFGDETFSSLAAAAEKTVSGTLGSLGPTVDPGPPVSCRIGDLENWGEPWDPTGPCGEYFPIVYAPGDVELAGGRGQGILLVEGNLHLSGGVEFYGFIIVRGTVTTTGGQVIGALMVNNEPVLPTQISGTTQLSFSRCAMNRAVSGASQPGALSERSWVQLY
jgi:hypothetical protein